MGTVEKIVGSDLVLLWLDDHICKENNCTDLKNEFESNTTSIHLFHDVDRCRRFVRTIRNKKLYCIIQGKYAKDIIPDLIQYTTSPVVYIFCLHMYPLSEWAQDYECVREGGMFDHEKDLLGKLTNDLADYADSKVQEYRIKRAACDEWAQQLTNNAKRLRTDQCTLTFNTNPFDNQERSGEQPDE